MKGRELKFREWLPDLKRFHYWGLIDGGFVGPSEPKAAHSQYTGLKDKNGKEIYEGDIVRITYDGRTEDENGNLKQVYFATGFVDWNEHSTGWIIRTKSPLSVSAEGTVMTSITHGHYGYREVISNIYENPELLK